MREEVGGLWTLFKTKKTCDQVGQLINLCGEVTEQPSFHINRVLEVPASLRLAFETVREYPILIVLIILYLFLIHSSSKETARNN
jgi:hypothetical protein